MHLHLHLLLTTLIWVFTNDVLSVSNLLQIAFDFGGILSVIRSSMLSQGSMKARGEFLGAMSQIQSCVLLFCWARRQAEPAIFFCCWHGGTWSRTFSAGHGDTRSGRSSSAGHGDTRSQRYASSAGQGDVLAGGGKRSATSKSWAQGRA
jgi:hypothetical protein